MDKQKIEFEARSLQREIYKARATLFPAGAHPLTMLRPEIVAEVLDLDYITLPRIPTDQYGMEVAGLLDLPGQAMYVSQWFNYRTQRFTAFHECGHVVLHPDIASGQLMHRELPNAEMHTLRRSLQEQEADHFAACFLMPARQLLPEFEMRFGKAPLRLTDRTAFDLAGNSRSDLYIEPHGGLRFPMAVATKNTYNGFGFKSLADHFSVTPKAMAIRLRELGLVRD